MTDKDKQYDNLERWRRVEVTDPDHTKPVSFGRKFTAIDAHYQVKMATKEFGSVGEGWGYTTKLSETHLTDGRVLINCDLRLWWNPLEEWEHTTVRAGRREFGPIRGCAVLVALDKEGKLKPDTDAPKKAMTDALTKCLSHLGFNADVFLGMFDDNKYVEHLREQKKESRAERTAFIKAIERVETPEGIDAIMKERAGWLGKQDTATLEEIKRWVAKKRKELEDGPE
jgi:hypothetical protein